MAFVYVIIFCQILTILTYHVRHDISCLCLALHAVHDYRWQQFSQPKKLYEKAEAAVFLLHVSEYMTCHH